VAEGEGFELSWLLHPSVFKTAPIGLSGNLPYCYLYYINDLLST